MPASSERDRGREPQRRPARLGRHRRAPGRGGAVRRPPPRTAEAKTGRPCWSRPARSSPEVGYCFAVVPEPPSRPVRPTDLAADLADTPSPPSPASAAPRPSPCAAADARHPAVADRARQAWPFPAACRHHRCRYSTRRRPLGAIERSTAGRSTTNSVRWAGKTCSDEQHGPAVGVGGDPLAAQHGRADRDAEQLGVVGVGGGGADRLDGAAERRRRAARRTTLARPRPGTGWAPSSSGHHTVTRANGSPSARLSRRTSSTVVDAEHLAAPAAGRGTKPKSRIRRSERHARARPSWASMVPSRPSDWRSGSAATNQPKPWRASTRPSSRSSSSALRTVTRLAP